MYKLFSTVCCKDANTRLKFEDCQIIVDSIIKNYITMDEHPPTKSHKTCFVPLCGNTTRVRSVKNKKYFGVPMNIERRRAWWQAARRLDRFNATNRNMYCCEDHFDLQSDTCNWVRWNLMGGRLLLKDNVVPHLNIHGEEIEYYSDSDRPTGNIPIFEMTELHEQRMKIKSCFNQGKTFTQTHQIIKQIYGDQCMSRTRCHEWYKRFKDGRESIVDNPRSGRPSTTSDDAHVAKVREIVRSNPNLTLRELAKQCNISLGSCYNILKTKLKNDTRQSENEPVFSSADEVGAEASIKKEDALYQEIDINEDEPIINIETQLEPNIIIKTNFTANEQQLKQELPDLNVKLPSDVPRLNIEKHPIENVFVIPDCIQTNAIKIKEESPEYSGGTANHNEFEFIDVNQPLGDSRINNVDPLNMSGKNVVQQSEDFILG